MVELEEEDGPVTIGYGGKGLVEKFLQEVQMSFLKRKFHLMLVNAINIVYAQRFFFFSFVSVIFIFGLILV